MFEVQLLRVTASKLVTALVAAAVAAMAGHVKVYTGIRFLHC